MEPLMLLVGWAIASVAMVAGHNVIPVVVTISTAIAVVLFRAYDRRRYG